MSWVGKSSFMIHPDIVYKIKHDINRIIEYLSDRSCNLYSIDNDSSLVTKIYTKYTGKPNIAKY